MRTLTVLRHAKSSWDAPDLDDFERPLAPRGQKAAPRMGQHLRTIGLAPDLVLVSPAIRARETAQATLPAAGLDEVPLQHDERLYEATASDLLHRLRELDPSVGHVLLIGHNPGLHELVLGLLGGRVPVGQESLATNLPTAAVAVLALDISRWPELDWGKGRLEHYQVPRNLA